MPLWLPITLAIAALAALGSREHPAAPSPRGLPPGSPPPPTSGAAPTALDALCACLRANTEPSHALAVAASIATIATSISYRCGRRGRGGLSRRAHGPTQRRGSEWSRDHGAQYG